MLYVICPYKGESRRSLWGKSWDHWNTWQSKCNTGARSIIHSISS